MSVYGTFMDINAALATIDEEGELEDSWEVSLLHTHVMLCFNQFPIPFITHFYALKCASNFLKYTTFFVSETTKYTKVFLSHCIVDSPVYGSRIFISSVLFKPQTSLSRKATYLLQPFQQSLKWPYKADCIVVLTIARLCRISFVKIRWPMRWFVCDSMTSSTASKWSNMTKSFSRAILNSFMEWK